MFVASFVLSVFCDFSTLDLQFVCIWCKALPFIYDVILLLVFVVFSRLLFVFSFYVLILGNWLGKRKVNGAQGEPYIIIVIIHVYNQHNNNRNSKDTSAIESTYKPVHLHITC